MAPYIRLTIFQQARLSWNKARVAASGASTTNLASWSCGCWARSIVPVEFAALKNQIGAELGGQPAHRVILHAGGDAQAAIALPARFRDHPFEQQATDATPAHAGFNAERDFRQAVLGLLRRMQLGRTAHDAVFHVGDDDGAVAGAFGSVALYEAVIQEAVEAVMAAGGIEPQQMVAQQRQFFVLAQRPHIAKARPGTESIDL